MILDYTLFGERNSGTNYARMVLDRVLNLRFTSNYGFKHWYVKGIGSRPPENTTTDNECLKSIHHSHHTLFVFILRNPFDWVGSMFMRPYHMNNVDRSSLHSFIKAPYISYETNRPVDHGVLSKTPWHIDSRTNTYYIESAENILQLRNSKNEHFKTLGQTVRYFHLVKLETLKIDIDSLIQHFDLECKVETSKALNDFNEPKTYELDTVCKEFIISQLNNSFDSEYYL